MDGDEKIAHLSPTNAVVAAMVEQVETARPSINAERQEFRRELAAAYDRTPEAKELQRVARDPNQDPYREARLKEAFLKKYAAIDEVPASGRSVYRSAVAAYADRMESLAARQPGAREQKAAEEAERERMENSRLAADLKEKLRLRRATESPPSTPGSPSQPEEPDNPG